VLSSTIYHTFALGVPRAELMGGIGVLALAANVGSVLLLMRYKDGDANVRSVWLCSRNDAIGNCGCDDRRCRSVGNRDSLARSWRRGADGWRVFITSSVQHSAADVGRIS